MSIEGRLYKDNNYEMLSSMQFVIVVDEYQDCSNSELELVIKFAKENDARCIFVGDADQAIYGWRGATANATKFIKENLEDVKELKLTQTFRCPKSHTKYIRETMEKDGKFEIFSYHDKEGELYHVDNFGEALQYVNPKEKILVTSRNFNGRDSKILPAIRYVLDKTNYTIRLEGFNLEFLTKRLIDALLNYGLKLNQTKKAIELIVLEEEQKIANDDNYFVNFKELLEELKFAETIVLMCKTCETPEGVSTFVKTQLNDPNADITFSTVFRIKGQTFYQTILLDPVPHYKEDNLPEINEQEDNILFVGLSRATDRMILVHYNNNQ